ncbi:MAG: YcxB family protein [Lachnospiraceae bacterium]
MKEKLEVKMTHNALYDFLLYHTYSKFTGFLTNVLGMAVVFMGIIMFFIREITIIYLLFYILAGIAFLSYTPLLLWFRAKKQVEKNPEFIESVEYIFADDGIEEVRNQSSRNYAWEEIEKIVSTPKTIGIYYGEEQAMIFPKESFGTQFNSIMKIIIEHIPRDKVKIR